MNVDKDLLNENTTIVVLKLLEEKDMYGYEMIEALVKKSDNTFDLKAGTLYPLLQNLKKRVLVESYEGKADQSRVRKYYRLTKKGKKLLGDKQEK